MRILPLLTLAFVTFALGFGELMIAAVLPPIAADLKTSIPLAGQLVTVYALTFAVLSGPLAVMARRLPVARVLAASLLLVAAANISAAYAHAFGLLIAARIVAAAGSAVATPLAIAAIDAVADDDVRGRAHGIVFTGFSLAAMLGVPLGALIAAQVGWRYTFACVALLAGAAALAVRSIPATGVPETGGRPALAQTLRAPAIRRTLSVSTLFLTAQYTAFTYFRPLFAQADGAGIGEIVWLFFAFGVFGIAGTLAGGLAVDRWGSRPVLSATVAGCAVTLAALPLVSRTPLGATIAVAMWALTSWGFSPAVNHLLDADAGPARDVALALNLTAFNAGIAAGSALGGAVITAAGIAALPYAAAVICALAGLCASGRARTPALG